MEAISQGLAPSRHAIPSWSWSLSSVTGMAGNTAVAKAGGQTSLKITNLPCTPVDQSSP